jgi:hypothetical protein
MKFRVLWDVAPCSHVEVDRHFRGVYCLHHQGYNNFNLGFLHLAKCQVDTKSHLRPETEITCWLPGVQEGL